MRNFYWFIIDWSVINFFLLDTYKKIGLTSPESKTKSIFSLLICTLKHMKNLNQILIIPLSFWAGVELAFFTADFTKVLILENYFKILN